MNDSSIQVGGGAAGNGAGKVWPSSWPGRAVVGLDAAARAPRLRLIDDEDDRDSCGSDTRPTSATTPDSTAGTEGERPVQELSVPELVALAAPFLSGAAEGRPSPPGSSRVGDVGAGMTAGASGGTVSGEECVRAVEAMHVLVGRLAAGRLAAVGTLATRAGEVLLGEAGVAEPGELSVTRREEWRRRAKMVAAGDVAAVTGWGRGKARELVAVALGPGPVRAAVGQGLRSGVASWWQVEKFWRETRLLAHEDAAVVARSLFGTDVPPGQVAVERLDVDGRLAVEPWQDAVFVRALAREVARAGSADPGGQARARAARRARRDAFAVLDDDGTGEVVVRGEGATAAACADRLHLLATRLRQRGDERTVAQLRADLAHALLLHGTLPLGQRPPGAAPTDAPGEESTRRSSGGEPGAGGTGRAADDGPGTGQDGADGGLGDDLISPQELERLAQVLTGTPAYHLQVIVPWDTLTGRPVTGSCAGCTCGGCAGATGEAEPDAGAPTGAACSDPGRGAPPAPPSPPPDGPPPTAVSGIPRASARPGVLPGRVREGVGLVLSRTPLFLTGAQLRAMALAPGTTLSRVLFDPADGRCVERSLARYAPDRAMREQVLAADVTSRGVGSATLARDSQLDHVLEHLAGGPTTEGNLQALDLVSHLRKTRKEWAATIDARRDVTWTSFFGRVYRTRAHDYRQYLTTGHPATSADTDAGAGAVGLRSQDRRHLASLLTYAALTARQVGARLEAPDDDPDGDDTLRERKHPAIWLRRTRERDGRRTGGPRPGTPTPEQMIATPAATILTSDHWTDPFTRPEPTPRPRPWNLQDDPPPF